MGVRVRVGVVVATASLGVFMAFVDDTVVAIAFPNMVRSFHGAKLSELSWVLNAYNIAFAALMIPAGRLADRLGRRRIYVAGVALFTVASAVAAAAPSLGWLIAARAVQGAGAAILVPASLAIVLAAATDHRRPQAVAAWSASAALAAGIGPSIGGALVDLDNWRLVFVINVPVGVFACWLAFRLLAESRAAGDPGAADIPGAALIALAIGALTLGAVEGPDWGWGSPGALSSFAASAVAAVLLARRCLRRTSTILDLDLLRTPRFAVTSALTIVGSAGFFALGIANVLFMIRVWRFSPLETGLATTPAPFIAAAAAVSAGRLALRFDPRRLVLLSGLLWTAGPLLLLTRAGASAEYLTVYLPAAALLAVGVGFAFSLISDAAVAAVPAERYGGASALNGTIRQLGAAIGIAILAALLAYSGRLTSAADYHSAWVFAAACFLVVAIGSCAMAPFRVSPITGAVAEPGSERLGPASNVERPARWRAVDG